MPRKPDIQYVRFYTDGSAARQLEPVAPKKKTTLPKVKRQKRKVIYVDPLAIGGIVISVVLLLMMAVGSVQLHDAQQQMHTMESDLSTLTKANAELWESYEAGYNLELIKKSALAIGMIPAEDVQQITISVPVPQQQVQMTQQSFWEKITVFFEGLFA